MKKFFIVVILLFLSIKVFPLITLQFDPSEPPRYEIKGLTRVVDDVTIDIYYRKGFKYSYINTIVFKNGSFKPNSVSIDIPNLDDTVFYAVYRLNNSYTDISG